MPIIDGLDEMTQIFDGTDEIQVVYDGTDEIWTNLKAIDLGYGTSFNIRTLLPKVDYTKLTVDNFYVLNANGKTWYDGQDDGIWYRRAYFRKSYNASTGVFSCYFECDAAGVNGTCRICFVNKPNKLVPFDQMKTKYASKWHTFNADNIIAKSFSPTEELLGVGSPYSITANSYMTKSYTQSTGTLNSFFFTMFFKLSRVNPDRITHNITANGIYVIPKLIPLSEA